MTNILHRTIQRLIGTKPLTGLTRCCDATIYKSKSKKYGVKLSHINDEPKPFVYNVEINSTRDDAGNVSSTKTVTTTSFTNDLHDVDENEQSGRIFIVHGHDEAMLHNVARVVEKLGLEPIILREQPDSGFTIIEKFEEYTDVSYAIVLLSPDDVGRSKSDETLHSRPRQNVLFELGFFVGRLTRKHVMALHRVQHDFEMLSDYKGVLFVPYNDGWKMKLVKELRHCGIEVDANRIV